MFQTTRRRLALWYTTVTAILLLVFASGFYGYVRLTLIDRVDDTIDHVVEVLGRSLTKERTINLQETFGEDLEADRIDIEWFDPAGTLVWSSMPVAMSLPLEFPQTPHGVYRTVRIGDAEPLRQLTQLITVNREVLGYLRISHPWFEVTKPIQQLFLDLLVGVTVTIAVVALCGWWLSGIAMEPVRASYQRLKQFTADASHELRNPVAAIQTNIQVALADPEPNWSQHRQQLETVERITRRITVLLDDMLFLARQDGGLIQPLREPCDLGRILREVLEEQQAIAARKGIALTGAAAAEAIVLGDRDRLVRLFTNLIDNAIAYTPPGGSVTLVQTLLTPQPQVQVQVRDTGIGIPQEALPQIFERFWRYQPQSKQGSGLGLAISRAIVESHRGQIAVESEVGKGTTFTVTLPMRA